MANVVEVLLKLRDELSGGLAKAGSSFDKFSLTGAAKMAGLGLSVAGVGYALKKMAGAGAEAERVENMLADALQRHGVYSDSTLRALNRRASAMAMVVRADDEEIKAIQTQLVDAGIQVGMLEKVTEATLDLAVAKRMDGVSAAQLIRMAFISESGAIRGITASATGAAGSAERLNSIMAQLNTKFGGKAEADVRGSAGAYAMLGKQFGETSEVIGGGLNVIGKPLAEATVKNLIGIQEGLVAVGKAARWLGESWEWMLGKTEKKPFELPEVVVSGKNPFAGLDAQLRDLVDAAGQKMLDAAANVYTLGDALKELRENAAKAEIDTLAEALFTLEQGGPAINIKRRVGRWRTTPMGGGEGTTLSDTMSMMDELVGKANAGALEIEQTWNSRVAQSILSGFETMAAGVGNAFAAMLVDGESFTTGFANAFRSMARMVIAEIARIAAQWAALSFLRLLGFSVGVALGAAPVSAVGGWGEGAGAIVGSAAPGAGASLGSSGGGTIIFNSLDSYTMRDWFLYGPGRKMMRRAGVEV